MTSLKGKYTKDIAELLNKYYNINLTTSKDGDWWSKEFNDTLAKFLTEKGYEVKYCKTGDGYCPDGDDGVVYNNTIDIKTILTNEINKTSTPQEKINTTNDKSYDYKLSNGKYYFKGKPNTTAGTKYPNWVEAKGKGLESIKNMVKFV